MSEKLSDKHVAIEYQERTEHRLPNRFAASLGYLDWESQPNPFRVYHGAEQIQLPLCEPTSDSEPTWQAIRSKTTILPVERDSQAISQLLFDSLAISAWKKAGSSTWALRCNPSSGNLHPTEAYLLVDPIEGLNSKPALLHYAPGDHALEVLRYLDAESFNELSSQLPPGAFLIGLSSIVWREAWKYGERAFRYCMHDVGHAIQALSCAARILGWRVRRVEGMPGYQMDQLLALDLSQGPEAEHADVLLVIEPLPEGDNVPLRITLADSILAQLRPAVLGRANELSPNHENWPVLAEVEEATRDQGLPHGELDLVRQGSSWDSDASSMSARVLVRQRRSAVDFDGDTGMSRDQFYRLLTTLVPAHTPSLWTAFPHRPRVHPLLYLHRIQGLEPGLALLIRNPDHENALRSDLTTMNNWQKLPGCPDNLLLYRLATGDAQAIGKLLHCHQDIGAQGALVTSMLAFFDDEMTRFGAAAWRYLHWEAGAIGQLLYLEAEAMGLSATGIGCFFDQGVHELLGIQDGRFRMVYGTAIGRAVQDPRLQTLPAYAGKA